MLEKLKAQLRGEVNFPSPPALAMRIINLMSEADIDMAAVAAVISKDPGMTAKMLRIANSGVYATRRKSENLRQAIVALGLNAASTIALSFSFVDQFKRAGGAGIDYSLYWRRALLSAIVARGLASLNAAVAADEMFLAALLQDLGVLAIDRIQPNSYAALPKQASHAQIVACELQTLQSDHAALGAWLLRHWRLPERLCAIVESSHSPTQFAETTPIGAAARCLALGAECAELLLLPGSADERLLEFSSRCVAWLGVEADRIQTTLAVVMQSIPEVEQLFDLRLVGFDVAASLLEQANQMLSARTLQALEQVHALEERSHELAAYATALEDKSRRDALTGVFNRGHLDETAQKEFLAASEGRWPLSVVFVDLDRFKEINDAHGHAAGDGVLQTTARILAAVTRESDFVGRYGGEEFVLLLPGTNSAGAQIVCRRLLEQLRAAQHPVGKVNIRATASLGLATHSVGASFASLTELVKAADVCVRAAKRAGRDRLVVHELAEQQPTAAPRI